jgi:hypothetical protein
MFGIFVVMMTARAVRAQMERINKFTTHHGKKLSITNG